MTFLAIGFDVVFVLWSYTPLALGGLQREPKEIGAVLSVAGAVGIASTLVIFPYLHQRFKTIPLFTASLATWGVVNALIPSVGFVIRKVLPQVAQQELAPPLGKLWGFVFCIQMAHWIAAMAWPAYMLVVKESVSDSRSAGALFGLAAAANSLGEGTAPAVTSSLFALSNDRHLLGGNLVWAVMIGMSVFAAWFAGFGLGARSWRA